ncbi:MAG: metallophosphoesterase [Clostridia bacterium]|nr:metallophosphoesterase [Clostridia bacterium]
MTDISYLTKNYDEKICRIVELDAPLNFVFITDQHNRLNQLSAKYSKTRTPDDYELAVNAVEAIRYVVERCPKIDCVISGGDIGNDYFHDPQQIRDSLHEIANAMYTLPVPVHCVIGNHDDAVGTAMLRGYDTTRYAIKPDELHDLCMKSNPTAENYYFIDHEASGTRLVFLNTSDNPWLTDASGQYTHGYRLEISAKQIKWFAEEALSTDKKVLVVSHGPLTNRGMFGSVSGGIMPYDNVRNNSEMLHLIRTHKNVKALIAGHVHYDNIHYLEDFDHLVSITTMSSYLDLQCFQKRWFREETETAFDVFSVKDSRVHITRFGAGTDRIAHFLR